MPNQKGPTACSLGLSLRPGDIPGGTGLASCFLALSVVPLADCCHLSNLPYPAVGLWVSQVPMTLPAGVKQMLPLSHRSKALCVRRCLWWC